MLGQYSTLDYALTSLFSISKELIVPVSGFFFNIHPPPH